MYSAVDEVPGEDMNKEERAAIMGPEEDENDGERMAMGNRMADVDDAPGFIVPFDGEMHVTKR